MLVMSWLRPGEFLLLYSTKSTVINLNQSNMSMEGKINEEGPSGVLVRFSFSSCAVVVLKKQMISSRSWASNTAPPTNGDLVFEIFFLKWCTFISFLFSTYSAVDKQNIFFYYFSVIMVCTVRMRNCIYILKTAL